MKTLTLLFLLCSAMVGQGYESATIDDTVFIYKDGVCINKYAMHKHDYEPKLTDYLQPHATNVTLKQDALQLLVEEYELYEKECYADSALKRVHEPPIAYKMGERIIYEGCLVDWDCIVESHYKNKWIHKQPTFEGFMSYLKRRLK